MADAAAFETVSISPTEYDVFLSFRGKENFTSHLYTALTKAGFRTFLGDGEEVSINRSELNEAIHKSRVFIIVFSQHYLSSRCCLDDLLMILSCKRRYRRVVIPVFLSVDPSDVRHQTGSIAEAMKFVRHQYIYTEMDRKTKQKVKKQKVKILGLIIKKNRKSYTEMDHKTKQKLMADLEAKIGKWREALTEAGNLMSGIYLGNIDHDPEEKFIKKVVERIVEELRIKVGFAEEVLTSAQGLVGVPNYKINIEDWENAPQKKTVVSRAQRFHEYLQLEHASLLDHYDKSLITDNKQLMTRNLLPDSGQLKKVVLKVELYDDKVKQKAMKVVSGLSGVDSIAMEMKDKKLTVTGDIDPVTIVGKLRKLCHTEIVTVGPAKEPEKKKEEPKKKDDPKKEEPKKKDDPKKEEPKKKDEAKKDEKKKEPPKDDGSQSQGVKAMAYPIYTQPPYYPQQQPPYYPQQHPYYPPQQPYYPQQQVYYNQQASSYQQSPVPTHYYHRSVEEDPNSCVIC